MLTLIMIFMLAAPAAAQEEPVQYIDVQVDVLQTGGLTGDIAPLSENSVEDQLYEIICAGIEERLNGTVEGGFGKPIDISSVELYFKATESGDAADQESVDSYLLLQKVYTKVANDHPRWIFMLNGFQVGLNITDRVITQIGEFYDANYETLRPAFEAAIAKALAAVSGYETDLEKVMAAHDYLIKNCEYNLTVGSTSTAGYYYHGGGCRCLKTPSNDSEIYSAYGALVDGDAVCQGYALAFKLLLDEMEIESVITSSAAMNHAWNMVKLGEAWYHVDVTWDDATPDRPGGGGYTYFLLSDATNTALGRSGWEAIYECNSVEFESGYAFNDADLLMYYWNDEYYYIAERVLYKGALGGGKSVVTDEIGGYYYTALWHDDQVFFVDGFYSNTQFLQLKRCDLTTGQIANVGEQQDFVQTPYTILCTGEGASNGQEIEIYSASYDLAGIRLSSNGANIEIVSTTRREVLATIPFVDHPIEWDDMTLAQNEKAKLAEPELDEEEEKLEIGLLLAEEHEVRNIMVAFYNGDKLAGLRMVPVASTAKGLVIIDNVNIADLPAWDTAKVFAMSGADQEHSGFALCANIKGLEKTN